MSCVCTLCDSCVYMCVVLVTIPLQISSFFLNGSELQSPGSLSAGRVSQLAPFLPWLGVDFLQKLSQSQLSPVLTALASVPFTPAQVEDHHRPSQASSHQRESSNGAPSVWFSYLIGFSQCCPASVTEGGDDLGVG